MSADLLEDSLHCLLDTEEVLLLMNDIKPPFSTMAQDLLMIEQQRQLSGDVNDTEAITNILRSALDFQGEHDEVIDNLSFTLFVLTGAYRHQYFTSSDSYGARQKGLSHTLNAVFTRFPAFSPQQVALALREFFGELARNRDLGKLHAVKDAVLHLTLLSGFMKYDELNSDRINDVLLTIQVIVNHLIGALAEAGDMQSVKELIDIYGQTEFDWGHIDSNDLIKNIQRALDKYLRTNTPILESGMPYALLMYIIRKSSGAEKHLWTKQVLEGLEDVGFTFLPVSNLYEDWGIINTYQDSVSVFDDNGISISLNSREIISSIISERRRGSADNRTILPPFSVSGEVFVSDEGRVSWSEEQQNNLRLYVFHKTRGIALQKIIEHIRSAGGAGESPKHFFAKTDKGRPESNGKGKYISIDYKAEVDAYLLAAIFPILMPFWDYSMIKLYSETPSLAQDWENLLLHSVHTSEAYPEFGSDSVIIADNVDIRALLRIFEKRPKAARDIYYENLFDTKECLSKIKEHGEYSFPYKGYMITRRRKDVTDNDNDSGEQKNEFEITAEKIDKEKHVLGMGLCHQKTEECQKCNQAFWATLVSYIVSGYSRGFLRGANLEGYVPRGLLDSEEFVELFYPLAFFFDDFVHSTQSDIIEEWADTWLYSITNTLKYDQALKDTFGAQKNREQSADAISETQEGTETIVSGESAIDLERLLGDDDNANNTSGQTNNLQAHIVKTISQIQQIQPHLNDITTLSVSHMHSVLSLPNLDEVDELISQIQKRYNYETGRSVSYFADLVGLIDGFKRQYGAQDTERLIRRLFMQFGDGATLSESEKAISNALVLISFRTLDVDAARAIAHDYFKRMAKHDVQREGWWSGSNLRSLFDQVFQLYRLFDILGLEDGRENKRLKRVVQRILDREYSSDDLRTLEDAVSRIGNLGYVFDINNISLTRLLGDKITSLFPLAPSKQDITEAITLFTAYAYLKGDVKSYLNVKTVWQQKMNNLPFDDLDDITSDEILDAIAQGIAIAQTLKREREI